MFVKCGTYRAYLRYRKIWTLWMWNYEIIKLYELHSHYFSSYSFQFMRYPPSGARLNEVGGIPHCMLYLSRQNVTNLRSRNVFDKSQGEYLLADPLSEFSTLSSPTRVQNLNNWRRTVDDRYIHMRIVQDRIYF